MMYTVKKLMFSAFSSTLLFMLIARKAFSRISLGSGYIGYFCKADIRNPLSLLAHERSRFANCQSVSRNGEPLC